MVMGGTRSWLPSRSSSFTKAENPRCSGGRTPRDRQQLPDASTHTPQDSPLTWSAASRRVLPGPCARPRRVSSNVHCLRRQPHSHIHSRLLPSVDGKSRSLGAGGFTSTHLLCCPNYEEVGATRRAYRRTTRKDCYKRIDYTVFIIYLIYIWNLIIQLWRVSNFRNSVKGRDHTSTSERQKTNLFHTIRFKRNVV